MLPPVASVLVQLVRKATLSEGAGACADRGSSPRLFFSVLPCDQRLGGAMLPRERDYLSLLTSMARTFINAATLKALQVGGFGQHCGALWSAAVVARIPLERARRGPPCSLDTSAFSTDDVGA